MNTQQKKRISVQLNMELYNKLDKTSNEMGMSQSALCGMIIGTYLVNYQRMAELLTNPQTLSNLIEINQKLEEKR